MEANFGDSPFQFDLEAMLVVSSLTNYHIINILHHTMYIFCPFSFICQEVKHKVHHSISSLPLPMGDGVWQSELHR